MVLDCFVYAVLKYDGDDSLSGMDMADWYYVEKL